MLTTLILLCIIIILDLVNVSLNVLVLSIVLVLIAYKYKRKAKYDYIVYTVAIIIGITAIFINIEIIRSGLMAAGMFTLVMFTGVVPNKWLITKKLKSYRGFYSILGFIFILPHGFIHLFFDQQINFFGIASLVLMVPLFITSFQIVRKEMKDQEWIKLQKIAYLIYPLVFIHVIMVADVYGKVIYAILMTLYINNKLLKEFRR